MWVGSHHRPWSSLLVAPFAAAAYCWAVLRNTYGIPLERSTAASLAATAAATTAGRSLVTNMIKFVPGAGTAVAAPISATVAGTFTYAMGHAWLRVCERMARGDLGAVGGALDGEGIRRVFMEEFKSQASRRKLPS